jgi:hypothetical protein
MNLISSFLTCTLLFSNILPSFAQTQKTFRYNADLLIKNSTSVDKKSVVISQEEGGILKIDGTKDSKIAKTFANSSIKNVSYSYSDKPQIKEAVITTLLLNSWFIGLPFFFNKTKKHWLVLTAENEIMLFELQKENYRRLLFDLSTNGIMVEDLGDKDSKETPLQKPKPDANFIEGNACGNLPEFLF